MGNLELFAQNTIRKHLWVLSGGQRKWALARDHDREERRRSIWPRLTLTADKTWMITTPVHYQRRSSSTSVFGWVGEWVSVSLHLFHYLPISSSSSSASSSASPLCAIIIIIHLPPSEYFILLMTIISSHWRSLLPLLKISRSLVHCRRSLNDWFTFFSSILSLLLRRQPQHTSSWWTLQKRWTTTTHSVIIANSPLSMSFSIDPPPPLLDHSLPFDITIWSD